MSAVGAGPPADGALNSTGTSRSEVDLEGVGGLVGSVSPQAMVTGSNSKTSVEVEDDSPDSSIEAERDPVGGYEADERNNENESSIDPVDVEVDIGPIHRSVGNVSLVEMIFTVASERLMLSDAVLEDLGLLADQNRRCHLELRSKTL